MVAKFRYCRHFSTPYYQALASALAQSSKPAKETTLRLSLLLGSTLRPSSFSPRALVETFRPLPVFPSRVVQKAGLRATITAKLFDSLRSIQRAEKRGRISVVAARPVPMATAASPG